MPHLFSHPFAEFYIMRKKKKSKIERRAEEAVNEKKLENA